MMNPSMVQRESVDGFQFILYKFSGMAGKLTHIFPRPRREDVVSHPVSEWKKQDTLISYYR